MTENKKSILFSLIFALCVLIAATVTFVIFQNKPKTGSASTNKIKAQKKIPARLIKISPATDVKANIEIAKIAQPPKLLDTPTPPTSASPKGQEEEVRSWLGFKNK